ncbi:MAG: aspartate aminotransferase family protein [Candidatus Puniceispirillaceae bacterium]
MSQIKTISADNSAVMPTYGRLDLWFERGEGSYLYDTDGVAYLDCASGIAVNNLGHNHPHLVAALKSQIDKLWHVSNLYRIEGQERLAARLAQATGLDHVFFCNSGAEANEGAVKMARRYHHAKGDTERMTILCAGGAFHGRTLGMLAATDRPAYREGFGPVASGFMHVPFGNLNALRDAMSDKIAAIFIEPVQGEGGANAAPEGYLDGIRAAADEFGALVIADEIQCGMGRTGTLFAYQQSDIRPDIIATAKGLGGGFPMGAIIAREQIGAAMGPGSHGTTFGGNPLAAAAGNAVMDVLEEDGFFVELNLRIAQLEAGLSQLASDHQDKIAELRGLGFLRGLQLCPSYQAGDLNAALRDHHVLAVPAADNVLRLLPPLTISEDEINTLLGVLQTALKQI